MSNPRGVVAAVSALIMAALASSCAQPDQQPGGSRLVGGVVVTDRAGMLEEYHSLADAYPWPLPKGVSFPETLAEPPEPTMYEEGEGLNQADSFWICAWMGEWLATRTTDADAAATAWSWVERADETQLHRDHYDDPRDVWHREILAPAHEGHPRTFREFYATSCGFPGLDRQAGA